MQAQFLPYCQFHLKRFFHAQPVLFGALALSCLILVTATLAYLQQWQSAESAKQDLIQATLNIKNPSRPANKVVQSPTSLPEFSGAKLVDALHQIANDVKLPVDEVSFSFDGNVSQPFLRYRATLSVSASYPIIRRFVDQVQINLPNVSLDTISCARADIGAVELSCDLAFSAFYRKEAHG